MYQLTLEKIRQLRGAPLSVYLVLVMAQQRVSQDFVQRHTGYTDKPVSQALAYLQDLGVVDHTQSGWALSAGQMVLGSGDEDLIEATAETPGVLATEDAGEDNPESDSNGGSRNNSDSLKLSKLSKNQLINQESYLLTLSDPGRKNSDLRKNSDSTVDVLVHAGVIRSVAVKLAPKIAVSVGQLRAIIWEMSQERNYTPGLLVHRLRKDPEICQRQLTWTSKSWSAWLADQQIAGDFDLVADLAREYPDPGEALDKLPLAVSREILDERLWEVVDV